MAELGQYHPEGETAARLGALPGSRFTPGVVFSVEKEQVGPEAAGAVLILQSTLADAEKAAQFWARAASTIESALGSTGFIRLIGFGDGPETYALAFWRTIEEAEAYAKQLPHREAVKELYATGNQYSHFAGLFSAPRARKRHIFCEQCGVQNDVRERCAQCGNPLVDSFLRREVAAPA
jgi:heme-degrading monooxygenase HmoA